MKLHQGAPTIVATLILVPFVPVVIFQRQIMESIKTGDFKQANPLSNPVDDQQP